MVTHENSSIIEIKRFLGVAMLYQRYLWDFTSMATTMCKLFKKDEPFNWVESYEKTPNG
jgi:hypothetical protein